jgi:hypothetical protein
VPYPHLYTPYAIIPYLTLFFSSLYQNKFCPGVTAGIQLSEESSDLTPVAPELGTPFLTLFILSASFVDVVVLNVILNV